MNWGGAYVTDVPYVPGYFRAQAPQHLALACLLGGVAPPFSAGSEDGLHYLELGCGQGFGALALAAGNRGWRVTGVDFNPAHVAAARALAAEAGVDNAAFIEADLATLAEDEAARAIAPADVVSLHGVWSWVPPETRAGIVRLLRAKVRPGGLVHLSYNALPAWQGALGMQRMIREAGKRSAARSDRQALAGLDAARALAEAGGERLREAAVSRGVLEQAAALPAEYLAHEYMNASWSPCFHADVAEALSGAKLDWVASANLLENFAALALSDAERAVMDRFDDPAMRELVKDMCLARGLRNDVFVRGPARLDPTERDRVLGEMHLALLRPAERVEYEAELPVGTAALERAFYGPIVAALDAGPRPVRALLTLPDVVGRRDNPAELAGILAGTDQAMPVAAPPGAPDPRAVRFNRAAARRFARPDDLNRRLALAGAGLGGALPCQALDLYVCARLHADPAPDPDAWADEVAEGRDPAERDRLHVFLQRMVRERVPVWRRLGVLSP